ncbi:MAG: TIGR04282 family arsenosugar biosynthesis glycosyltransferase [Chloroflexi bacterium]|nr:TIGR04282 family arsenosugar biosynthesis glycosyltransferase [Chloroflexota bacterium]
MGPILRPSFLGWRQNTPAGVVYVVAKAPRAGAAKTRLCPPLSPEQAARLAEAFLRDVLAAAHAAGLSCRLICRDRREQRALQELAGRLASVHVQFGRGLGDAMESAFLQGLRDGFRAVGVLGADTPTLPAEILSDAFAGIDDGADVAIGPSEDGGYYLLVARALHAHLFRDIPWSTSTVGAETIARCRAAGLRVHTLPAWYDVDDAASLARLQTHLAVAPASLAQYTRAALTGIRSVTSR